MLRVFTIMSYRSAFLNLVEAATLNNVTEIFMKVITNYCDYYCIKIKTNKYPLDKIIILKFKI